MIGRMKLNKYLMMKCLLRFKMPQVKNNQSWFNSDITQNIINLLAELAERNGVVIDNEKYSLWDLADFWESEFCI